MDIEKPTAKQVEYASMIAKYFNIELPKEESKAAYQQWIGKYNAQYKKKMAELAYMEAINSQRGISKHGWS